VRFDARAAACAVTRAALLMLVLAVVAKACAKALAAVVLSGAADTQTHKHTCISKVTYC
jgi:hypothetical protein